MHQDAEQPETAPDAEQPESLRGVPRTAEMSPAAVLDRSTANQSQLSSPSDLPPPTEP